MIHEWIFSAVTAMTDQGVDRPLFPLGPMDKAGFVLASFFIMIAAGGGIGGGGVLVPSYIFILGFKPHIAIPLSNVTILGSSIANCILNAAKRHPTADRPLIDWDIMLVMEPLTIAGAVMGSVLNILCPPWLLCVMLVLLLGATTIKTGLKGVKLYKKETLELEQSAHYTKLPGTEQDAAVIQYHSPGTKPKRSPNRTPSSPMSKDHFRVPQKLETLLKIESTHSCPKMMAMFICTMGTLTFTILKGGNGINPLGLQCGSGLYWFLTFAVVPFTFFIAYLARRHLVERYYLKKRLGYTYHEGDVEWNEKHTVLYPACCSIAGLCAGLFGIGGGIVKGPLMLEMGTKPQVASATSATMILFTSSAASVSYLLFNSLNLQYAAILFPLGFVCTLIGQIGLNAIVKYYGRASLVILCIATVIGMSTFAMGFESSGALLDLFRGVQAPEKSFCS